MSKDTRQLLREAVEKRGIAWDAVTARVHADNAGIEVRDAEWLVKSLREDKSAPVAVANAIISLLADAEPTDAELWKDRAEAERQAHEATIKQWNEETSGWTDHL